MFKWLFGDSTPSIPKYRIRYIEGYGFIPEHYDELVEAYQTIRKDLTEGVYQDSVTGRANEKNFHETEAEAGETMNAFVRLRDPDNNVVWTSND